MRDPEAGAVTEARRTPSSYRPICLLDTLGKLLKRVILNRVAKCTESENGLSERQFGFRKGKSTVDAIRTVLERAEKASKQKRRGNRYCAIVTIELNNAYICVGFCTATSRIGCWRIQPTPAERS